MFGVVGREIIYIGNIQVWHEDKKGRFPKALASK